MLVLLSLLCCVNGGFIFFAKLNQLFSFISITVFWVEFDLPPITSVAVAEHLPRPLLSPNILN